MSELKSEISSWITYLAPGIKETHSDIFQNGIAIVDKHGLTGIWTKAFPNKVAMALPFANFYHLANCKNR